MARTVTYAVGALIVALILMSTGWTIWHDRQIVLRNAETQLTNVAAVIAEQTRIGLRAANRAVQDTVTAQAPGDRRAPDEAFHRFFADLYAPLELGYEGRVVVFSSAGTLLTAYPPAKGYLRTDYGEHVLFAQALRRSDVGTIVAPGFVQGDRRLVAYRKLQAYPIVIAISSPVDMLLAEWRNVSIRGVLVALVFATLAAIGTLLLGRQLRISEELAGEVRNNEARLQSIINSAMDAIITVDERQNIILFNAAARKIFGCPASEAVGSSLDRFIPERYRAAHHVHVRHFGEADLTVRRMGGQLVLAGLRATGEEFPIDASISHVTVDGHKFYTVILRDVTERQQAVEALNRSHVELREMYESMHQVREAERTRIARELHDELAQWLTALKMDAAWIGARLPSGEDQLGARAERMKGVIDNTVKAVRRIAADLRPVMLDDLGLLPAVENLLADLSQRNGIVVSLHGDTEELSFREPLSTAVYRMVQEALTNVARHAQASSVDVEMRIADNMLCVRIQDNGRGFQPDPDRKSFGVLGIRERAKTLGGSARIYSPEAGGTIVEIEVPLKAYAAQEARA